MRHMEWWMCRKRADSTSELFPHSEAYWALRLIEVTGCSHHRETDVCDQPHQINRELAPEYPSGQV